MCTENLLSQSFVRFRDEDDVLPTVGGEVSEGVTSSSPTSVTSSLMSSTSDADADSVVDICTVRSAFSSCSHSHFTTKITDRQFSLLLRAVDITEKLPKNK